MGMMKLLPIILGLVGLAAGLGAGLFLRPVAEGGEVAPVENLSSPETAPEFVKMNNQFIVPVLEEGRVAALVILSLTLEIRAGAREEIFEMEPKLRDGFLQVMFDHANAGGFKGVFTDGANLALLRSALREVAQKQMGEAVRDVLLSDIVRQDS
jgi:flagellar protein FliL